MLNDILVDTNPLVYIYTGLKGFGRKYADLLGDLSQNHTLWIPKIVYGELSLIFEDTDTLDTFLNETGILIREADKAVYTLAAERWQEYNEKRVLICHSCGDRLEKLTCRKCKSNIKIRQHILSDFLIGAIALRSKGGSLVTNDKGFFVTYFPELKIYSI